MLEHTADTNAYINDRAFVERMIAFASSFVYNPDTIWVVELLLATLDYDEVFKWAADPKHFDTDSQSDDISLVKSLSEFKKFSDVQNDIFSKYLDETLTIHSSPITTPSPGPQDLNPPPAKGAGTGRDDEEESKDVDYETESEYEIDESDMKSNIDVTDLLRKDT
eukprot:727777_1